MKPNKIGQVVKFHTPLPDENPKQLYVLLEIKEDDERPRTDAKALNKGLSFHPIHTVLLDDLEVVEVDTTDLVGQQVSINKADYSQPDRMVVKVSEQKNIFDLTKGVKGVETNVWLTIIDKYRQAHTGTLFVD